MSRKALAAILAVAFVGGTAAAAENAEHEIKALKSAKYPLVEAIRLAETQANGPAIYADFDSRDNGAEYEIKVLSADGKTVREFKIDAASGKIIEAEKEPFESLFARLKSDSILEAPMDLATAAVTAQKLAGGTALEAELDTERDTVLYNVKVAKGNTIEEIKLNAAGKLASAR